MATGASSGGSGGGRRKRLTAHLEAAFAEIERLADTYRVGIETLERNVRAGLSSSAVRKWFLLYLRVVDLGVQIRRGEIRHRSMRQFAHPCMHTTGTKGAVHSGLSIDDANALYHALEHARLSESRLDVLFMRMDALDNDCVGALDMRLNKCLDTLLSTKSTGYNALEVTGSDPHQELLVKCAQTVATTRRTCFRPTDCVCDNDATPWTTFALRPDDDDAVSQSHLTDSTTTAFTGVSGAPSIASSSSFLSAASTTVLLASTAAAANDPAVAADNDDDVGLSELKRQFGFEPLADNDNDDDDDATSTESAKRRRLTAKHSSLEYSSTVEAPRLTPMQIYARKCRERNAEPNRKLRDLLVVTDGALHLDLSPIGFHAPEHLQDLLDVVAAANVPIRSLDATNNFFNAQSFALFCDLLRLPALTLHIERLVLRCVALPQRSAFPALLRIFSTASDGSAYANLRVLDLSYNTFTEDSVLCLDAVLRGLTRLDSLSLESCFTKAPDPEVVAVAVVKDLVREALATCCHRLRRLDFGSNWMSFALLNALFAPASALHELVLPQMTFFCFDSAGFDVATSWDLHVAHLDALTLSATKHSRVDFVGALLCALVASFRSGFVQLKRLDLTIGVAGQQSNDSDPQPALDALVLDLLEHIGGYGMLEALRLRIETPLSGNAVPNYERVLAVLLAGGFPVCTTLELTLGLPLSLAALCELIALAQLPTTRTLRLSIVVVANADPIDPFVPSDTADPPTAKPTFATAFAAALLSVDEFTLEVKVSDARRAELLSDETIHEVSEAWRALDRVDPNSNVTRDVAMTKRKIRRPRGSGAAKADALATFVFVFTKRTAAA